MDSIVPHNLLKGVFSELSTFHGIFPLNLNENKNKVQSKFFYPIWMDIDGKEPESFSNILNTKKIDKLDDQITWID